MRPPEDAAKWARICANIVRHYNEGWADGFHYGITYWEIWNEPDNEESIELNNMWKGTKEQYYDLYAATAPSASDVASLREKWRWESRAAHFLDFLHGLGY